MCITFSINTHIHIYIYTYIHIYMYERGSFRLHFAFVLNGISHVTTPYLNYLNYLNSLEVDFVCSNYLNSQMGFGALRIQRVQIIQIGGGSI